MLFTTKLQAFLLKVKSTHTATPHSTLSWSTVTNVPSLNDPTTTQLLTLNNLPVKTKAYFQSYNRLPASFRINKLENNRGYKLSLNKTVTRSSQFYKSNKEKLFQLDQTIPYNLKLYLFNNNVMCIIYRIYVVYKIQIRNIRVTPYFLIIFLPSIKSIFNSNFQLLQTIHSSDCSSISETISNNTVNYFVKSYWN